MTAPGPPQQNNRSPRSTGQSEEKSPGPARPCLVHTFGPSVVTAALGCFLPGNRTLKPTVRGQRGPPIQPQS